MPSTAASLAEPEGPVHISPDERGQGEGLSMAGGMRDDLGANAQYTRTPVIALLMLGSIVCLLSGCGADMNDLSTASVASYQPASLFSPMGYSVSANADGSVRVTAAGPPATPADRLEKIALARAAEYGAEQNAKTFRATSPQVSITCGKTHTQIKQERVELRPLDYRMVSMDVTYGADAGDVSAKPTKQTAEALKAELQSETVPPDVQAAAVQEVSQHCGR